MQNLKADFEFFLILKIVKFETALEIRPQIFVLDFKKT